MFYNDRNLIGINKLVNGDFDADKKAKQLPTGWSEWSSRTGAINAQTSKNKPYLLNLKKFNQVKQRMM